MLRTVGDILVLPAGRKASTTHALTHPRHLKRLDQSVMPTQAISEADPRDGIGEHPRDHLISHASSVLPAHKQPLLAHGLTLFTFFVHVLCFFAVYFCFQFILQCFFCTLCPLSTLYTTVLPGNLARCGMSVGRPKPCQTLVPQAAIAVRDAYHVRI